MSYETHTSEELLKRLHTINPQLDDYYSICYKPFGLEDVTKDPKLDSRTRRKIEDDECQDSVYIVNIYDAQDVAGRNDDFCELKGVYLACLKSDKEKKEKQLLFNNGGKIIADIKDINVIGICDYDKDQIWFDKAELGQACAKYMNENDNYKDVYYQLPFMLKNEIMPYLSQKCFYSVMLEEEKISKIVDKGRNFKE